MSEPRNRRCERDKGGREGRRKRVEELDERGGVSSVRVGRMCRRRHGGTRRAVAQLICVDVEGPRGDGGRDEEDKLRVAMSSESESSPHSRDVSRQALLLIATSASHLASVLDSPTPPTRRWSFVRHVKICV